MSLAVTVTRGVNLTSNLCRGALDRVLPRGGPTDLFVHDLGTDVIAGAARVDDVAARFSDLTVGNLGRFKRRMQADPMPNSIRPAIDRLRLDWNTFRAMTADVGPVQKVMTLDKLTAENNGMMAREALRTFPVKAIVDLIDLNVSEQLNGNELEALLRLSLKGNADAIDALYLLSKRMSSAWDLLKFIASCGHVRAVDRYAEMVENYIPVGDLLPDLDKDAIDRKIDWLRPVLNRLVVEVAQGNPAGAFGIYRIKLNGLLNPVINEMVRDVSVKKLIRMHMQADVEATIALEVMANLGNAEAQRFDDRSYYIAPSALRIRDDVDPNNLKALFHTTRLREDATATVAGLFRTAMKGNKLSMRMMRYFPVDDLVEPARLGDIHDIIALELLGKFDNARAVRALIKIAHENFFARGALERLASMGIKTAISWFLMTKFRDPTYYEDRFHTVALSMKRRAENGNPHSVIALSHLLSFGHREHLADAHVFARDAQMLTILNATKIMELKDSGDEFAKIAFGILLKNENTTIEAHHRASDLGIVSG